MKLKVSRILKPREHGGCASLVFTSVVAFAKGGGGWTEFAKETPRVSLVPRSNPGHSIRFPESIRVCLFEVGSQQGLETM